MISMSIDASNTVFMLASGTNALGMLRALAHINVDKILFTNDKYDFASKSKYLTQHYYCETEFELIKNIEIALEKTEGTPVVLVGSDDNLEFVEKNRKFLEGKVHYQFVGLDLISTLVDKRLEVIAIANAGVPMPKTWVKLNEIDNENYPIIIKPALVKHQKIIDACAANGVIIELNANPRRLDIDWRWMDYILNKNVLLRKTKF